MHANLISSTNAQIPKSDCPRCGIYSCTSGSSLWKKFLPLLSLGSTCIPTLNPHAATSKTTLTCPRCYLIREFDRICIVGHQVRASEILKLQTFCLITVVQNFVNKARFLKQLQFLATASDHRSIDSALIYAILQSFCGINSCTSGTSWWKFLSIMLPVTLLESRCNLIQDDLKLP